MGVAPASGSHLPAGREIALCRGGRRHVKGGAPRRAAALSLPLSSRARRSAVCVWLCGCACARANTATGRTSPALVSSEIQQNPPPIACAPLLRDFSCFWFGFKNRSSKVKLLNLSLRDLGRRRFKG